MVDILTKSYPEQEGMLLVSWLPISESAEDDTIRGFLLGVVGPSSFFLFASIHSIVRVFLHVNSRSLH